MRTVVVVVIGVVAQHAAKMRRVPDRQMVKTFAADGSDHAFDVTVHPRRMRFDRSIAHAVAKHNVIGVVVHQKVLRPSRGGFQ